MSKGSYVLIVHLAASTSIRIGALGDIDFPSGLYAYSGSAQSGLENRVGRHFSKAKKRHWHIDYLLEHADVICAFLIEGKDCECPLNIIISELPTSRVVCPGFGSSDCECDTHLHLIGEEDLLPLLNEMKWLTTAPEPLRND